MSHFAFSIPDADRSMLSVLPPPVYRSDATFVQQPSSITPYREQMMAIKEHNVVRVDEELDVYNHPGSLRHYRMMIRSFPFDADLRLIMSAAQHMLLVDEYDISYEEQTGLDPSLERGYFDVSYTIARESFYHDADTSATSVVYIPYAMRRRIWTELFSAMGHTVRWGSSVLNVRKKR